MKHVPKETRAYLIQITKSALQSSDMYKEIWNAQQIQKLSLVSAVHCLQSGETAYDVHTVASSWLKLYGDEVSTCDFVTQLGTYILISH